MAKLRTEREWLDLAKFPHWSMFFIDSRLFWVIRKICPELKDFRLWHKDGKLIDIDFYFTAGEPSSVEEFTKDSPTYRQLSTVTEVLVTCLDLKFEEE